MATPHPERPSLPDSAQRILASARLVALDVDGTLTDGSVAYIGDEELVRFDVHDGQGLVWLLRDAAIEVALISGRGSRAVERRAQELGVREVHLRVKAKGAALADLQQRLRIEPEHTLAMGDDLVDLALRRRAALFVAPANARIEVRRAADLVTLAAGGAGAVRELAEHVLEAKGLWRARVDRAVQAAE